VVEVHLVLFLIFDLVSEPFEHPAGGRIIVDSSGRLEGFFEHRGSGHKIVREDVVQHTLDLEQIVCLVKFLFESSLAKALPVTLSCEGLSEE
jgi:hypothetical protein